MPGSDDLVRDLRALGLRLLGLTNWSAETFHLAEPAAPAIGLLEDVLVSGEVGVAKPDPEVFALLTGRFGLRPERTVFVDDSAPNVAAAAAAGFDAVLFTTADALRADLAARGLPLAAHLGSTPCDCSSPELPRPRCRRSRRSCAPATRWSPSSRAPTPAPGGAGPPRRARSRRAPSRRASRS